jgi:hypothetical protein
VCTNGWTGATCDNDGGAPIDFGRNESEPTTISISSINGNSKTGFLLNFNKLSEISPNSGLTLTSYSLQNLSYVCDSVNSDVVDTFSCYSTFSNGGNINFTFAHYKMQYTTRFAGSNYTIAPQTVKLSVKLSKWPFRSIRNYLILDIKTQAQTSVCNISKVDLGVGYNGSVRSYSFSNGLSTLYGTFDDKIEVDDQPQFVATSYNADSSSVEMTIPFFWSTVLIDPNYNVLLSEVKYEGDTPVCAVKEDDPNTLNSALIIGLCVSIPGSLLVAAAVVFYLRRERTKRELRKLRSKASSIQLT